FSPRDWTPEATKAVIERETPGISEAIRQVGMKKTPTAMLSRAAAGIRKSTLIINLPGSEKAVREGLEAVMDVLPHGVEILKGTAVECGKPHKKG
ncbi:MAG: MogA/MoaB family molybdenum cofactor biosynthesis protein, partial [Candidatus Aminicenantales bacterium]